MKEPTITAEDLNLYALNLLSDEEGRRVELLLQSSPEAKEELALIRGDLAAFALGAEQHTPPALTRQRLMKQVARERRIVPIPTRVVESKPLRADQTQVAPPPASPFSRIQATGDRALAKSNGTLRPDAAMQAPDPTFVPPANSEATFSEPELRHSASSHKPGAWVSVAEAPFPDEEVQEDRYTPALELPFSSYGKEQESVGSQRFASIFGWAGWAAAAALAVATIATVRQTDSLQDQARRQSTILSEANASALRAETVMQTLQSNDSQRFVLARTDTAPVPSGRVAYLPEHGSLIFQGNNLEALPAYKTYELWLIPVGEGRQPIAAGTFKPDERGFASVLLPELPPGTIASNFGITVEEDGGASAPTLPILLVGQQS